MEPSNSKKRKPDENGSNYSVGAGGAAMHSSAAMLTKEDILRIIEPLTRDQLSDIVATASLQSGSVLSSIRALCSRDLSQRKLFIRGLGWETTQETLKSVFSAYGEFDEAAVITDKTTGKSKGYGFITFRYVDGAILALKEPSKKIDGRVTVTQLAASGGSGPSPGSSKDSGQKAADVALRKIFVGNVPPGMSSERLLSEFATFGELEAGPLGIDKQTGKFKGFALFVYKNVQGAQAALANPNKLIDEHWLVCKPGGDGKKGKDCTGTGTNDGNGMPEPGPAGPFPPQYTGPGTGVSSYNGMSAGTGTGMGMGMGTGISFYGGGFNLRNPMNNPNPNPNNNNNNGGIGVGSYGPGPQCPGSLAGLGLGTGLNGMVANLGNSASGFFRMNQGNGYADPGTYPFHGPDNHNQPGFVQPGPAQHGLGHPGHGQVGPGQPGLGHNGRMQGGFYSNTQPFY